MYVKKLAISGADWWKCCSVEDVSPTIRSWSNPGQGQLGIHREIMEHSFRTPPSVVMCNGSWFESKVRHLTFNIVTILLMRFDSVPDVDLGSIVLVGGSESLTG